MQPRGVQLGYSLLADGQREGELHNPLFELLAAVHEQGSIQHAAKSLGASYRHVWGALKHWQQVLGEPLVTWSQGQPARLTPFAERLHWAETRARARLTPHIEALRAELQRVMTEALDGAQQVLTLFASHDPALARLREQASTDHRLHLDLRSAGPAEALQALAEGRCHLAGFQVPLLAGGSPLYARALKPLLQPARHQLIGFARRCQGLLLAPGNPHRIQQLGDLAGRGLRFVGRQPGSGTRLLTEQLMAQQGLTLEALLPAGTPIEDSHQALAATIASGQADVGIGLASAAAAHGLDFIALAEEDCFLVGLKGAPEPPVLQSLCQTLQAPGWRAQLSALPGYQAQRSGERLTLTRTLPWWKPGPTARTASTRTKPR